MKSINSPNEKAAWENDLLKDLTFIKAKKRYPLSKKTFKPAAIAALIITVIGRTAMVLFFASTTSSHVLWVEWLIAATLVFFVLMLFYQYYQMLVFHTIKTKFSLTTNADLLKKFFTVNHLAFTRHNDAPEVFMIVSRNLDANPNKDYREVMVFIADDYQILVNSHFTGTKFSIAPPSRNFKKMSKQLSAWLDSHISNSDSNVVTVTGF